MSNYPKIVLFAMGSLLASPLFAADWNQDCQTVQSQSPTAQNMCQSISDEVSFLNTMASPPPFISTTIGKYPPEIFPGGLGPWSNMPSGGESGGRALPPEGGASNSESSGGGTWQ